MPDTSQVMTHTKRDTLVLQVGGWGMRLKLIQKFFEATKSEIHFRISSTIKREYPEQLLFGKEVFCFLWNSGGGIFRATDKVLYINV